MKPLRREQWIGSGRASSWLCGGALALYLVSFGLVLYLVVAGSMERFLVGRVERFEIRDQVFYGIARGGPLASSSEEEALLVDRGKAGGGLIWLRESELLAREPAPDVALVESRWGWSLGRVGSIRSGDREMRPEGDDDALWLSSWIARKRSEGEQLRDFERGAWRTINLELEELRVRERDLATSEGISDERRALLRDQLNRFRIAREREHLRLAEIYESRRDRFERESLVIAGADSVPTEIPLHGILRATFPNRLSHLEEAGVTFSRVVDFLRLGPSTRGGRGGVYPALFGTALMVLLMSVAVMPLGVLAAIYLREYARQGPLTRAVHLIVANLAGTPSIVFGVVGLGVFVYAAGTTIDELFHRESLPAPTFGTGGLLWASLTLSLLTLPVVIVATDEGLRSVPKGVREAALALGATRFEAIRRVILPAASPAVLTGLILAVARAAGEVAPLMIVGLVNAAPSLPVDDRFPFVHLERKSMHLGLQVFEGGFHGDGGSGGMEAVYASALLLLLVVTAMNGAALLLRHQLWRRHGRMRH